MTSLPDQKHPGHITQFAPEVVLQITNNLGIQDILALSSSCRTFYHMLTQRPLLYTPLILSPYAEKITSKTLFSILKRHSTPASYIQDLDLSGCYHLSSESVIHLAKRYPHLTDLDISVNPRKGRLVPGRYREAGHDLDSSTAYAISQMAHLTSLDISGCTWRLSQADLQTIARGLGKNLLELRILGFEPTDLTLLCLRQHCWKLKLLHLSGGKPLMIFKLTTIVHTMKSLQDIRVTQIRGGDVDSLVQNLNPDTQSLDLSAKMDMYPSRGRGMRIESALNLTPRGFDALSALQYLQVLRLSNLSWISEDAVSKVIRNLPLLSKFELRMWPDIESSDLRTCDVVTTLVPDNVPNLTEITLVGVSITQSTALAWSKFKHLEQIELSDIGVEAGSGSGFIRNWLMDMVSLEALRVTKCGIQWQQVADIVRMRDSEADDTEDWVEHNIDELVGSMQYEDEVVIRRSRTGWEWRWS
ncbi:hypothetical protein K450DRAFT_238890 [Umbelopsis ramanniana AG]|uniref:F-box domain-containing protein n=1 Tax=Umbelopsis ramanniana AG TaxID=1314678 RepID=A0AAD5HDB8_UMBRA|nr:uncharacterized protein K450DRAFT_238890 [Umbelopsis ramanniana AG]KAI8580007.1 hypothetical protein K450DRAFT_238890 [Umbelopsis ramanniana AG]